MNKEHEELVLQYLPLVRSIAKNIRKRLPSNIELDDLVSAGTLGLIDASQKFDASTGYKFNTYAQYRIHGAILDELRKADHLSRRERKRSGGSS